MTSYKFALLVALNVLLISVASARAGAIYSACGSTIPPGAMCQISADEYKSTMYELGLCSSDPMASGTLDKTSCETVWANPAGLEVNPAALMSGSSGTAGVYYTSTGKYRNHNLMTTTEANYAASVDDMSNFTLTTGCVLILLT
jgi:hypothetical protein